MTINSVSTDSISTGEFDFDGIYRTTLESDTRSVRIRDLESYSITSIPLEAIATSYYTRNSITPSEFSYSYPKPLEERFSNLESLVQVMNNTIQQLILEIHELKKKCQDDNK